jgi:hypothetical protein
MGVVSQDTLARVYSRIVALKHHLPPGEVEDKYVEEYHDCLRELEPGFEVEEFKIPPGWVIPTISVIKMDYETGKTEYGKTRHVRRDLFFTKVDGLLNYFELLGAEEPQTKTVHFKGPARE